jgi:hypothetical protein
MSTNTNSLRLLLLVPVLAACSASVSAGGMDFGKLESAITEELNKNYAGISQQVSSVECPRGAEPETGETFVCNADVDGNTVRVQATMTDDEGNVDFSTMDVLFDLATTANGLSKTITEDQGFDVTVTCGEGLKVVEIGKSFTCEAADPEGATRTVKVTAGAVGESDQWELMEE